MKKLSKLFICAARGLIAFIIIPMLYYILKTFLSLGVMLQQIAQLPLGIGFMVEILAPIVYIIAGLAWVFSPLLKPDEPETSTMPYYSAPAAPAAKPTKKEWFNPF